MDYITIYLGLGLLLCTPLLRVNYWLNPFIFFLWTTLVIHTKNPDGYNFLPKNMRVLLDKDQNELMVLVVLFTVLMRVKIKSKSIETVIKKISRFNIYLSLLFLPVNDMYFSGIVVNKAMNSILLIMLLPYALIDASKRYRAFYTAATFLCVLLSKSSSAYLVACVYVLWHLYFSGIRYKNILALILGGGLGVAGIKLVPNALYGGERFLSYWISFKMFTLGDWLLGMGPASFFTFSAKLQQRIQVMDNGFWIYMHSDPLQYLFEYGILGVPFLLFTLYYTLKHAGRREILVLLCMLTGSIFYYPFHFPVHLIFFFLIMKLVVNNYKEKIEPSQRCRSCDITLWSKEDLRLHTMEKHPEVCSTWMFYK